MSSDKVIQSTSTQHYRQQPTPSLAKRKKILEQCEIRSPTDNMMSPCTRQLIEKATMNMQSSPICRPRKEGKENAPNK